MEFFVHAIVFSHLCQQNPLVCRGNVKVVGMGVSFSYLTGFTGSIGFSFSQFPEETEKEQSRYAGEIKNRVVRFLWSDIILISGLPLEPRLAALGGTGFLSFRPRPPRLSGSRWRAGGKDKKTIKIVLILFISSNILRKIN
ncbi:MAG: hypothetical protein JRJ77_00625 [Deltaproteobacteria bacterium]|nr:hypothetical protein [Deltaproteobacteria bacterium]